MYTHASWIYQNHGQSFCYTIYAPEAFSWQTRSLPPNLLLLTHRNHPAPSPQQTHSLLSNLQLLTPRPHFYQNGSVWSMDQGSTKNHSPVNNFAPRVTKFCVMWEGQALPHDTKFRNCGGKIVDSRTFPNWSLIHGSSWPGLIKVGPGNHLLIHNRLTVCLWICTSWHLATSSNTTTTPTTQISQSMGAFK